LIYPKYTIHQSAGFLISHHLEITRLLKVLPEPFENSWDKKRSAECAQHWSSNLMEWLSALAEE
jgi:hypothetical protein